MRFKTGGGGGGGVGGGGGGVGGGGGGSWRRVSFPNSWAEREMSGITYERN